MQEWRERAAVPDRSIVVHPERHLLGITEAAAVVDILGSQEGGVSLFGLAGASVPEGLFLCSCQNLRAGVRGSLLLRLPHHDVSTASDCARSALGPDLHSIASLV